MKHMEIVNTRVFLKSDPSTNNINIFLKNTLLAKRVYVESLNIPNTFFNLLSDTTVNYTTGTSSGSVVVPAGIYNVNSFVSFVLAAMNQGFSPDRFTFTILDTFRIQITSNITNPFSITIPDRFIASFFGGVIGTITSSGGVNNLITFPNVFNFQRTSHFIIQSNINFDGSYTSLDNIRNSPNTDYNNIFFCYPITGDSGQMINQYIGQFAQECDIAKLSNNIQLILLDDNLIQIDLGGISWSISLVFVL